jgi:hypothetical protein
MGVFGNRSQAFGNHCQGFRNACGRFGNRCQSLRNRRQRFGNHRQRLGKDCQTLGNGCQRFGNRCGNLGERGKRLDLRADGLNSRNCERCDHHGRSGLGYPRTLNPSPAAVNGKFMRYLPDTFPRYRRKNFATASVRVRTGNLSRMENLIKNPCGGRQFLAGQVCGVLSCRHEREGFDHG